MGIDVKLVNWLGDKLSSRFNSLADLSSRMQGVHTAYCTSWQTGIGLLPIAPQILLPLVVQSSHFWLVGPCHLGTLRHLSGGWERRGVHSELRERMPHRCPFRNQRPTALCGWWLLRPELLLFGMPCRCQMHSQCRPFRDGHVCLSHWRRNWNCHLKIQELEFEGTSPTQITTDFHGLTFRHQTPVVLVETSPADRSDEQLLIEPATSILVPTAKNGPSLLGGWCTHEWWGFWCATWAIFESVQASQSHLLGWAFQESKVRSRESSWCSFSNVIPGSVDLLIVVGCLSFFYWNISSIGSQYHSQQLGHNFSLLRFAQARWHTKTYSCMPKDLQFPEFWCGSKGNSGLFG